MQYFSNLFCNRTLHVSDRFTVHHQESSTVYTVTGICHTGYVDCLLADQDGTVGVYLLIRFILSVSYWLNVILLLFSGLTIYIAGLVASLNVITALSTLRQLGLTIMTISIRLSSLAFFNLLTRALFQPDPASKQSTQPVWHTPIAVCTVLDCWWWTVDLFETSGVVYQNKVEK